MIVSRESILMAFWTASLRARASGYPGMVVRKGVKAIRQYTSAIPMMTTAMALSHRRGRVKLRCQTKRCVSCSNRLILYLRGLDVPFSFVIIIYYLCILRWKDS